MNIDSLISLLADGEFHSGEEIGSLLGVSRAAVWKQIQKVENFGLTVESIRGKGYRLSKKIGLLDESLIKANIKETGHLISELEIHSSIGSTNDRAQEKIRFGCESGVICLAEHQSSGRGRRGRAWVSPFAQNIYMSVIWHFNEGVSQLEGLSLCVGVAVANALTSLGVEGVELKWPNDVHVNGRKISGILIEMSGDADGRCSVVVGVGLNLSLEKEHAISIDQPWTDLSSVIPEKVAMNRNLLTSRLIEEIITILREFSLYGFNKFKDQWQQFDSYFGKKVVVHLGGSKIEGVSQGIDERGAILLLTPEGVKTFSGGEISLRRVEE